MKNLKFKKIKIAKINNLSMILGGNNEPVSYRKTIIYNCVPDSYTCPIESNCPNYCDTTTNTGTATLGNVTDGFGETDRCTGQCDG